MGKQMQKLVSELTRLYIPTNTVSPEVLEQYVLGEPAPAISLVTDDGFTRTLAIAFDKSADGAEAQHWTLLCEVANALQVELGLPAPAVSISGANGFVLWLSFAVPLQTARTQAFLASLRKTYFPDMNPGAAVDGIDLPPCLDKRTGRWAAFINPGLGASFADESGLEMAPPLAGQAALLDGLQSISEAQLLHAMNVLHQSHDGAPVSAEPRSVPAPAPAGLLLKDASLEDIVTHLHSLNIEPTFRHLIR
jgi:hypothetical protein